LLKKSKGLPAPTVVHVAQTTSATASTVDSSSSVKSRATVRRNEAKC